MRGLYVITQATECSTMQLYSKTSEAILGGASWVQFRHKSTDTLLKAELGAAVGEACGKHGSKFLVNDSIDLALTLKADGVHLGQTDGCLIEARRTLGKNPLIGRTCHDSFDLMEEAITDGASYCAFGRLFHSKTKPECTQLSLEKLKTIASSCTVPVIAIGGITVDNATKVIEAGADVIAVSSAIFNSNDIADAAHQLTKLF